MRSNKCCLFDMYVYIMHYWCCSCALLNLCHTCSHRCFLKSRSLVVVCVRSFCAEVPNVRSFNELNFSVTLTNESVRFGDIPLFSVEKFKLFSFTPFDNILLII